MTGEPFYFRAHISATVTPPLMFTFACGRWPGNRHEIAQGEIRAISADFSCCVPFIRWQGLVGSWCGHWNTSVDSPTFLMFCLYSLEFITHKKIKGCKWNLIIIINVE